MVKVGLARTDNSIDMPYEVLAELKVIAIQTDMYFRQVDKQKAALLHILYRILVVFFLVAPLRHQ